MYWVKVGDRTINLDMAYLVEKASNDDVHVSFVALNETGDLDIIFEGQDADDFMTCFNLIAQPMDAVEYANQQTSPEPSDTTGHTFDPSIPF